MSQDYILITLECEWRGPDGGFVCIDGLSKGEHFDRAVQEFCNEHKSAPVGGISIVGHGDIYLVSQAVLLKEK